MKRVNVINRNSGELLLESALWCKSRFCRLVGFQFRKRLKPGEAIILVHGQDSVRATSIHMFFVFMPLGVVWVNARGLVTAVQLARPWRPYYASPEPACYVMEANSEILKRVSVGDLLEFLPT